ncbi:MAG: outer membrane lipoprotein-sorting protein [Treponema sp.]|jgi:outer membrane lipoprotein-sorting protein|nr:outer membrane lipoprotein-sorting protein [Treponema sp.]
MKTKYNVVYYNTMKGIVSITVFFLFFAVLITGSLYALTDTELLKQADDLVSYFDTDFSAEYTIVEDKPGQARTTTVAAIFRRDSQETYVIVILQPSISRGQGYLKQGGTLWFYDPESKRFNTTSSSDRFQNTNASNSDFTRSTLSHDYQVLSGEDVALGKYKCRLLTLLSKSKGVQYPRMRLWISEDGLVRKSEDYSLSGQLLRTSAIPDYYKMGNRYVPKQILFEDALKGAVVNGRFIKERTLITITKPSFVGVGDYIFSKTYLEMVNNQ